MKIDLSQGKKTANAVLVKIAETLRAFAADLGKIRVSLSEKVIPLVSGLARNANEKLTKRKPAEQKSTRERSAGISSGVSDAFTRLTPEKKRLMFFALGGSAVFFIILLTVVIALNPRQPGASPANMTAAGGIPAEELFIPDEPDFLPDFLLDREPRHFWSVDDIRPYWRSPGNPAFWQDLIRSAVDELMENIP